MQRYWVMRPLGENFKHPEHCVITGCHRKVAENFGLQGYYAANSRIITGCVMTLKNAVLRLYAACISISLLWRYCQWLQYKPFTTRKNRKAKLKGKYIKRITLSMYCKWFSNNYYFPQTGPAQPHLMDICITNIRSQFSCNYCRVSN